MDLLKVILRVLLKISVCVVGGAMVGLVISLWVYDPFFDIAVLGGAIGTYVGILWSIENENVRTWLTAGPLMGIVLGVVCSVTATESYTGFVVGLAIGFFSALSGH